MIAQSRRYLIVYALAFLALVVAFGIWSGRSMRESQAFYRLYAFQLEKLAYAGPMATAFVGDSTLGNAIDARIFHELAHAPAINLALTGSYGYAGSYHMLRRLLTRDPVLQPRNVIIVQAPDMLKREDDDLAALMSEDGAGFELPAFQELPGTLSAYLAYLKLVYSEDVMKKNFRYAFADSEPHGDWMLDYVPQRPPLRVTPELLAREKLSPGINPGKLRYLEKIAALCKNAQVNCVYAHGPMLDALCAGSQPYFAQAAQAIRGTGLRLLADTPLCIPEGELGDAVDHVRPAFKTQATRNYYRSLAPLLQ